MMRLLSFFLTVLLLFSCKADEEFSRWPCRFSYDNSLHIDATLATATDVNSPGIFCRISENVQAGVKYLVFQNSHNSTTRQQETEEEKRAEFVLGLNNGIIVGFQNAVLDEFARAQFVGYDVQCPNCVRDENNTLNPTYDIRLADNGIGTCRKCGRRYDLNNGGLLLNGKEGDKGMEKYVAATTGPYGHVSVFRKR